MKIIIVNLLIVLFFIGCSTKINPAKNPEMLELNNLTVSFIKGGEYVMGTYDDKFSDKAPRKVILKDYYIDKTEVTNMAYRQYLSEAEGKARTPKFIDDPILGADELPVVGVTHKESATFCKFYNKRLPTEAEWEFAAKGGTTNEHYYWGEKADPLYMNYRESKKASPIAVGSYPANGYGLFDMNGNVREWVMDSYEKDFYKDICTKKYFDFWEFVRKTYKIAKDYIDGNDYYPSSCYINPINKSESKYKSNRGGSYEYTKGYPASLSFRFFDVEDSTHKDLGFRCATYEQSNDNAE